MRRLTASSLDRVARCVASAALPQVRDDNPSPWRDRGTQMHRFRELAAELGREEALLQVPDEYRAEAEAMPLEALPAKLAAEVAYVYDVAADEAREVGRGKGRCYPELGPYEIGGTVDSVGLIDPGPRGYVDDLKTGFGWIPPAPENWQLRTYALMVSRAHGVDEVVLSVAKLRPDESVYFDVAEMSALDLVAFAGELAELLGRVAAVQAEVQQGVIPDVHAGPWCRYCPAWSACPAKSALVHAATHGGVTLPTAATPEQVGQAWLLAREGRKALERVEEEAEAWVREHGEAPLPDGLVLREVPSKREYLRGDVVESVVFRMHGAEAAELAVETVKKATQASLKEALRSTGGKVAPALKDLMERLRAAGGVEVKQGTAFRAVEPESERAVAPTSLPAAAPSYEQQVGRIKREQPAAEAPVNNTKTKTGFKPLF